MDEYFDFEYLETKCDYGVEAPWSPEGWADCGEPAIAKIWWGEPEEFMYVCERHFKEIALKEKACKNCSIKRLAEEISKCKVFELAISECDNCWRCSHMVDWFKDLDEL